MQAYATAERLSPEAQLHSLDPVLQVPGQTQRTGGTFNLAAIDGLLGRLADLVVDRLMERNAAREEPSGEWFDARAAADFLGVHRDTLRKLAAERVVPVHQEGPGCKLYFRRDELDDWRRTSRAAHTGLRAVS